MTDVYQTSKLKTEEAFLDRLSDSIEGYISLNTTKFNFSNSFQVQKIGEEKEIKVYKASKKLTDVTSDKLIDEDDLINPGSKKKCDINAEIEIYRDEDFVYCHKITIESLNNCLTEEYKEAHKNETYAIDTCTWREV